MTPSPRQTSGKRSLPPGKPRSLPAREAQLTAREAALAAREAELAEREAEAAQASAPQKGSLLNNGDPHFKNEKEKIYDHFPLSVHQMDILIGVLVALIVIFVFL